MSVLGMLAIGGMQAQKESSLQDMLKTLPTAQAGIVSDLRAADATYWDLADAAAEYAGGTGTEEDPYLIETPEQLMKLCVDATGEEPENSSILSSVFLDTYFKQIADIDLSAAYSNAITIGVHSYFAGNYDGGGHKIKGYKVRLENAPLEESNNYSGGLFLNAGWGTLKNIVMEDVELVVNQPQISNIMFVYSFLAGNTTGSKIENCQVSGTADFNAGGTSVSVFVGGIVSNANDTQIRNCRTEGSIDLNVRTEGDVMTLPCLIFGAGIACEINGDSEISNCINNMDVTCTGEGTSESGLWIEAAGMAAFCWNLHLLNSANLGDIQANGSDPAADELRVLASGMIGRVGGVATVDNCWNASQVASTGGIAEEPATPLICISSDGTACEHFYFDKLLFTEPCEGGVGMETSEMQSPNFVETLNANLPEGALEWEYVEGAYPVLGEAQEEPETPTANESVTKSETVLRVLPGAVVVTSPEAVEFAAYTFSGAKQANELLPAGTSTVNLPAGLYILKVGDETYKVNVR